MNISFNIVSAFYAASTQSSEKKFDETKLNGLIKDLKSSDSAVVEKAVKTLADIVRSDIPVAIKEKMASSLVKLLKDADPKVRTKAVVVLAVVIMTNISDEAKSKIIDSLIDVALHDPDQGGVQGAVGGSFGYILASGNVSKKLKSKLVNKLVTSSLEDKKIKAHLALLGIETMKWAKPSLNIPPDLMQKIEEAVDKGTKNIGNFKGGDR